MPPFLPLPAYQVPGPLDMQPLSAGIDAIGDGVTRWRDTANRQKLGGALAKGDYGGARTVAAQMGDPDAVMKVQGLQDDREERAKGIAGRLASVIQRETDPAKAAALWQKLSSVHPEFGNNLRKYGVDPSDYKAGATFLMAEAGIAMPEPERPDFVNVPGVGLVKTHGGQASVAIAAQPESMTPYQRAQIDLEKQKLSQGDPGALIEQGKFEQNLRKERSSAVADYRTVADSYARIQAGSADASGAGDIAVVYGYMKMLDPGSVVREGEFATAENTAGVPAQVTAIYNKILKGERLPPETREQFKRMAGQLYQQKRQEADEIDNRFGTIADQYRVPRSNVILPYGSQTEPPIGQPPQPQPSAPVRIGGDADYNALPSGTQFIAPDGTLRVKP